MRFMAVLDEQDVLAAIRLYVKETSRNKMAEQVIREAILRYVQATSTEDFANAEVDLRIGQGIRTTAMVVGPELPPVNP